MHMIMYVFHWSSLSPADIDECLEPDACGENFVCTNNDGGFICSCAPNYYLNGSTCGEH